MKLQRIVVSDLHLGSGSRIGELNPFEDFNHDDRFAELLSHYDSDDDDTGVELIMNGDIFDLLKIKVGGVWPTEITDEIATEKLRQCLEGHPRFVRALRQFVEKDNNQITFLPGNHDLDMWFSGPQELFRRYVAPGASGERVHFITSSDTYYLPEGIQIRHGHQLERIHRVDYTRMTHTRPDGAELLTLPWGTLWVLEVLNPAKEERAYVDRIQPLGRFILGALLFDTRFALRFLVRSGRYFLRHRVFSLGAWRERLRALPRRVREEIISLGTFDDAAVRALRKVRGVHTLIVGHSHGPRYRALPGNKLLVNTGTWMKMINLDIQYLGQDTGLTYALIEYDDDGRPRTYLMRWNGSRPETETVPYAD
ncbi:MAG: metallophosphoesterase [Myxococcota bacterium]